MRGLCPSLSLDRVDLVIANSKYRNKVFQRGVQNSCQPFSSSAPCPFTCVCPSLNYPLERVCVGLCQKVYPIITEGYHYHFLHVSPPLIPLMSIYNLNMGAEPSRLSFHEKLRWWQAGQAANEGGGAEDGHVTPSSFSQCCTLSHVPSPAARRQRRDALIVQSNYT